LLGFWFATLDDVARFIDLVAPSESAQFIFVGLALIVVGLHYRIVDLRKKIEA
jgi:hypothetical protein